MSQSTLGPTSDEAKKRKEKENICYTISCIIFEIIGMIILFSVRRSKLRMKVTVQMTNCYDILPRSILCIPREISMQVQGQNIFENIKFGMRIYTKLVKTMGL
jgi:hypothetical protein